MLWLVWILATSQKDLRDLFVYILRVLETQLLAYISSPRHLYSKVFWTWTVFSCLFVCQFNETHPGYTVYMYVCKGMLYCSINVRSSHSFEYHCCVILHSSVISIQPFLWKDGAILQIALQSDLIWCIYIPIPCSVLCITSFNPAAKHRSVFEVAYGAMHTAIKTTYSYMPKPILVLKLAFQ